MTAPFPISTDAASPKMMAASVCLHALALAAVVVFSMGLFTPPKPPQDKVLPVRIVAPTLDAPNLEKLAAGVEAEAESPPEVQEIQQAAPVEKTEARRESLAAREVKTPKESIPIAKRKKPMRQVKAPKPPEKKPETQAKPKENPDEFLKKRLAALKEELDKKKRSAKPSPAAATTEEAAKASRGAPQQGGDSIDRATLQWFAAVRSRINAHWSIFAQDRQLERVTIIGVQLADDGKLIKATVDESSGDDTLDRSAMRAVFQAAPFPRVPAEVGERIRAAGGLALRFTVRGLQ